MSCVDAQIQMIYHGAVFWCLLQEAEQRSCCYADELWCWPRTGWCVSTELFSRKERLTFQPFSLEAQVLGTKYGRLQKCESPNWNLEDFCKTWLFCRSPFCKSLRFWRDGSTLPLQNCNSVYCWEWSKRHRVSISSSLLALLLNLDSCCNVLKIESTERELNGIDWTSLAGPKEEARYRGDKVVEWRHS